MTRGLPPPDPRSLSSTEFVNPPKKNSWVESPLLKKNPGCTTVKYLFKMLPFYICKKKVPKSNQTHNEWITKRIKVSCERKKELFVLYRTTNNYNLKLYYKK
jgi:hypothetical protein